MAEPGFVLQTIGLRKVFGSLAAVEGLDLELVAGGSLAIVGESGSGKTTVAKMIVGLCKPTSGSIFACGRNRTAGARSSDERRRRGREIQLVFQDPYSSLNPRRSARQAINEVLRLHHPDAPKDWRDARIRELADLIGLDARQLDALPRNLSGGQRQRVAIGRSLAADPQVLILDEAVAALDVSIQAQILNLLSDIRETTGISYVLISHDLAVVRQITDQTIVMRHGQVVERGVTEEILEHPQHPYTELLLSSVPRPGWKPSRRSEDSYAGEIA